MCGIAGLWDPDGRADLGRLRLMSELMRHRGPDDEGVVLLAPDGAHLCLGGADTPAEVFRSGLPFAPGAEIAIRSRPLPVRRVALTSTSLTSNIPLDSPCKKPATGDETPPILGDFGEVYPPGRKKNRTGCPCVS